MISKNFVLQISMGLHARPSMHMCLNMKNFDLDKAKMSYGDDTADMTIMMELLTLGVPFGEEAKIVLSGRQEEEAMEFVEKFFKGEFEDEIYSK